MSCDPKPPAGSGDLYRQKQSDYVRADGETALTAPLKIADGSQSVPSLTFINDVRSGFWRAVDAVCLSVRALTGLHCWFVDGYSFLVNGVSGKITHSNTEAREWTLPDATGVLGLQMTREAGLTAESSQTQGDGVLTKTISEISTCATTGDSKTLPDTSELYRVVINNGANDMEVFPASGHQIDGNAVDSSVTIPAGSAAQFFAYDSGKWRKV